MPFERGMRRMARGHDAPAPLLRDSVALADSGQSPRQGDLQVERAN